MKNLNVLILLISFNSFAADKVTCFKYNAKSGKYKESKKKSCNNKSWFETEEKAIEKAKSDCDKKVKKGKATWNEDKKLCISNRKANRNKNRCTKINDKVSKYTSIPFTYSENDFILSNSDKLDCEKATTSDIKLAKKIVSCLGKIEKFKKKVAKKGGDEIKFEDVFVNGRCDKKKIRRSVGVSDKRCKKNLAKISKETLSTFGIADNICESPSKNDLKMLKQLNKCERKGKRGKPFVFDAKSGKCINLKKNVDLAKVKNLRKPENMTSKQAQKCKKLTDRMSKRAKGPYVTRKDLEKLKRKKCILFDE